VIGFLLKAKKQLIEKLFFIFLYSFQSLGFLELLVIFR
jgi:hypothetical protein